MKAFGRVLAGRKGLEVLVDGFGYRLLTLMEHQVARVGQAVMVETESRVHSALLMDVEVRR